MNETYFVSEKWVWVKNESDFYLKKLNEIVGESFPRL